MPTRIDLTGTKFGRLSVVADAGNDLTGRALWECECACGGRKIAAAADLKKGRVQSCGCLAQEQRQAAGRKQCHAHSRRNFPRERKAWENMLARCLRPESRGYNRYGGRGVRVCRRWQDSFEAFFADMGSAPSGGTLERIDNNCGYAPGNCRWATRKEQANNRSSNRLLTYQGMTLTVSQWAERLGINRQTLYARLRRDLPVESVLTHKT